MVGLNLGNPALVFLDYRSRSGSTFFGDRLGRHPDVLVTPESNAAQRLFNFFKQNTFISTSFDPQKLIDYIFSEQKFSYWGVPRKALFEALKDGNAQDWKTALHTICQVYRDLMKPRADIVVLKKSGWYYKNLDLLLSAYPRSIAIGIIRDPRAVFNSARKAIHSEKKRPMAGSIVGNAFGWRDYVRRLKAAENRWPGRIQLIKYESLLQDVPGSLAQVWESIGVRPLSEKEVAVVLESRRHSNLVTASTRHLHKNVLKPAMIERTDKWREELSPLQVLLIRRICGKWMNALGYR